MRVIHGAPSLTLGEALDNFLTLNNNVARSHYPKYANAAKWGWRNVMLTTIWSIRQVYVDVDPETHSFEMPCDIDRLLNVSVVDDCGNIQPLTYDPNMSTLKMECFSKCSCGRCNPKETGTLCALIDNIQMRSQQVIINNQVYTSITYNRTEKNGTIYQMAEVPVWDVETSSVIIDKQYTTICKCEVDEHGCIINNEDNYLVINRYLGCFIVNCHKRHCETAAPVQCNHFGFWKEGANDENRIYLKHAKATKILFSYQTNGKDVGSSEIMVPEFAIDAFFMGIQHYATMFDQTQALGVKDYYEKKFTKAKKEVKKFMSPVSMEEFAKIDALLPTWAGLNTMYRHHGYLRRV